MQKDVARRLHEARQEARRKSEDVENRIQETEKKSKAMENAVEKHMEQNAKQSQEMEKRVLCWDQALPMVSEKLDFVEKSGAMLLKKSIQMDKRLTTNEERSDAAHQLALHNKKCLQTEDRQRGYETPLKPKRG